MQMMYRGFVGLIDGVNIMSVKLSKKEQLEILQQLRYGDDWPMIKQKILKFEHAIQEQSIPTPLTIWYRIGGNPQKYPINPQIANTKAQEYLQQISETKSKPISTTIQKKSNGRYFDNIKHLRCSKCNETGHEAEYCLQASRCMYCLSSCHINQDCQYRAICFKCYEIGHGAQKCKIKEGKNCANCDRLHIRANDVACFSLTKGRDDKKQLFPTEQFSSSQDMLCIRCRQPGHLSCSGP